MELTKGFFEDVHNIRVNNEMAEASLEELVGSNYFSNIAVFYGDSWKALRRIVENRQDGLYIGTKSAWKDLARSELFLAIREVSECTWDAFIVVRETNSYKNDLYNYLVNTVRAGIEMFLLNGVTLSKEVSRNEDEWPELSDNCETYVPTALISRDDTEVKAMNNIILQEIKDYLDEEEWLILTSDYGFDDELAKSLGINAGALRTRRHRIRERVKILF